MRKLYLFFINILLLGTSCVKEKPFKTVNFKEKYAFTLFVTQNGIEGSWHARANGQKISSDSLYIELMDDVSKQIYRFRLNEIVTINLNFINIDLFKAIEKRKYYVKIIVNSLDTLLTSFIFPEMKDNTQSQIISKPDVSYFDLFAKVSVIDASRPYLYTFSLSNLHTSVNANDRVFIQKNEYYSFNILNTALYFYARNVDIPYYPIPVYQISDEYSEEIRLYFNYLNRESATNVVPFNLKGNLTTEISRGFIIPVFHHTDTCLNKNVFNTIGKIKVKSKTGKNIDLTAGALKYIGYKFEDDNDRFTFHSFFYNNDEILVSKEGFTYPLSNRDIFIPEETPPRSWFPMAAVFYFEDTATKEKYEANTELDYFATGWQKEITIDY